MSRRVEAIFVLFFASGFAGLIYESVWSHYLKLFLGHAAYAQTLVLVVFIGGLALGSWLCARRVDMANPLRVYAYVEGAIGLMALVFHPVFVGATNWAYDVLMPATCSAQGAFCAAQWALGAVLLLPQSVLLGATFPLVTSAVLRHDPTRPGHHIAALYFLNSLGAVLGVVASAFLLMPWVGLPGTLSTAGVLNLVLAGTAWLLSMGPAPRPGPAGDATPVTALPDERSLVRTLLAVAFLTGLSSFIYEIAWIRMLSLVLGAATNSFELMLASFILGLALGGYWIRNRVDMLPDAIRFLAGVQVAMGLAALATIPLYNGTFDLMAWLLSAISRNDGGFVLFNLSSTFIALVVMLPATICAGMTLPLITYRLLRSVEGERSLGLVYSVNTLGSIAGVFVAVHLLLAAVGLHWTLVAGAAIDVGLGIWLLARTGGRAGQPWMKGAAAAMAAFVAMAFLFDIDQRRSASGVFRTGAARISPNSSVVYHRDGKTATVDVLDDHMYRAIRTNGKPDASLIMDPTAVPSGDEVTMLLLGALPLGHNPQAKTAAVIGFGSGMSTTVLLASRNLQRVDTIEIEPSMVEGARNFLPLVEPAYSDPRSRIVIDDAKSYFARNRERYDIIVSEPSNPWVSGVASLFSEEFYRRLSGSLNDGGVLCQWLHTYEMDDYTLATIFEAVAKTFPDFLVYTSIDADVILVARKGGGTGRFDESVLKLPNLEKMATRLGLTQHGSVLRRSMGTSRSVLSLLSTVEHRANSDYYPIVDQRAAKTRFTQARVNALIEVQMSEVPLLEMLDGTFTPSALPVDTKPWAAADVGALEGWILHDAVLGLPPSVPPVVQRERHQLDAQVVRTWMADCPAVLKFDEVLPSLGALAGAVNARLARDPASAMWQRIGAAPCAKKLAADDRRWLDLFAAIAARDADAMSETGNAILQADPSRRDALSELAYIAALAGNICRGRTEQADKLFETGTHAWVRPNMHGPELRYLFFLSHAPHGTPAPGQCVTAAR